MSKTITEQIIALQSENERLKEFQKLFDKAVRIEFGIDTKKLHKMIENQSDFEKKITSYFGLKSDADFNKFLDIFCTESNLAFFNNNCSKKEK